MKEATERAVKAMIQATENADDSQKAMRYSQSAVNLANAYATMRHAETLIPKKND